jgi:hypothetical protein
MDLIARLACEHAVRLRSMTDRLAVTLVWTVCLPACGDATAPVPTLAREIELIVEVSHALELTSAPAASVPIAAGLFMAVTASVAPRPIAPAVVTDRARRLLEDANEILAECALHLSVEAVQVVAVPRHLASVQGNERGSWGGHPPDSVGDPDLFTYQQNERLTSEARELFSWGKRHTSPNAIAIFVVQDIEYYIGEQQTPAGGLSFPPVTFHHDDDYPLRNSVLVRQSEPDPSGLPLAHASPLVHELGHMLLNTADHATDTWTSGRCERMRANRERLYGEDAVPDPGPPVDD